MGLLPLAHRDLVHEAVRNDSWRWERGRVARRAAAIGEVQQAKRLGPQRLPRTRISASVREWTWSFSYMLRMKVRTV